MHISRSIENCKEVYGAEFNVMKKDQQHKRKQYVKEYNKKDHEESYNPDKRRVKYVEEKKSDEKIEEKISEKIADKKEKKKYLDKHNRAQLARANWYENNSEEIKKKRAESYDPAKRRAKYQEKKEFNQKIVTKYDVDELAENTREYKKQWYKDNAQKIRQQRAESYNPEKRKASYRVCNKILQIYLLVKVLGFYFFLAMDEGGA